MCTSLYASLPDTPETAFSREMSRQISEVDVTVQRSVSFKRVLS